MPKFIEQIWENCNPVQIFNNENISDRLLPYVQKIPSKLMIGQSYDSTSIDQSIIGAGESTHHYKIYIRAENPPYTTLKNFNLNYGFTGWKNLYIININKETGIEQYTAFLKMSISPVNLVGRMEHSFIGIDYFKNGDSTGNIHVFVKSSLEDYFVFLSKYPLPSPKNTIILDKQDYLSISYNIHNFAIPNSIQYHDIRADIF